MSNQQTGAVTNEIAVDIKALLIGTSSTKAQGASRDLGNTKKTPVDPKKVNNVVREAVDFFEKFAKENQFNLKFSVDDRSKSVVVQVLEKGSGKLIRQIPPEEILKLRQRISDLLGMIYDKEM
jgi:flagellar protein FlaG